ncbi:MAG: RluA family pseudouridine synthase [Lachnospiraceae bacterium]|nr:RluA family pseudouridine synthase [Lachnospiraceae bacterium]
MSRTITYQIPIEYSGRKISEFLHSQGFSKQLLTAMRHTNDCIFLNGESVHMNRRFSIAPCMTDFLTDDLTVIISETGQPSDIIPVCLPFEIVYEDEDLMVVNKPSGMPIHPSKSNPDNALANALYDLHLKQHSNEPFIFRCVNRLDKDTSGLTIIAKHPLSAGILYEAVKSRRVERTYYCLVFEYDANSNPLPESGTIALPISRDEATDHLHSIRRYIDEENGAPAITHYQVLSRNNGIALVEFHLETGRTHQIRVHMSAIGFPLLGDRIYHPDDHSLPRQALHAGRLDFYHPINGNLLSFSVDFPDDMATVMANADISMQNK